MSRTQSPQSDQVQEALRESEAGLRRAQLLARLAHVVTGRDGVFEKWSQTFPELVGRTDDTLPRSTREWLAIVHPADRAQFRATAIEADAEGQRKELDYRLVKPDGAVIHVRQVMEPLVATDGEPTRRWFSTLQDLTDQRLVQEELARLNQDLESRVVDRTAKLEAANRELEAFSYSVSHDLRAPLRHIQGYAELLAASSGEAIPDKARRYIGIIEDAAREMSVLIDDLLMFSRSARTEMHRGMVPLGPLVDEAIAVLAAQAPERRIEWHVGGLPAVHGDAPMLRQVWANLLGNAVKYTRGRDPAVIHVDASLEADGTVKLEVRDNGVGFDMAYASRLFGVFQRLHRADEFEGTGIGLAIVQRIVERHGGRVGCDAAPGAGARFWFTLPLPPATAL